MTIYDKIAAIQDEVQNITKDAKNPHFGNSYATYEKVMEVLHPILRKHNLMVFHSFEVPTFENQIAIKTTIQGIGESKDNISTVLYTPMVKIDPQAAGSAITYAKRYSLLAMLGLGTEDDDANAGSGKKEVTPVTEEYATELCPKDGGKLKIILSKKNGKTYHACTNGTFIDGVRGGCDYFTEAKPKNGDELVINENGSKSWGKTEFSEPH